MEINKETTMKHPISPIHATNILLTLNGMVIVYHLLILFQLIPYENTWGGKLSSVEEMIVFELISLSVNLLIMLILLMNSGKIKSFVPQKVLTIFIWIFIVIFGLNTLGNLLAENWIEKLIATPLTLLATYLLWIVVKK